MASINGTSSDDVLSGTRFNDTISSLAGNDTLTGGGGQDTFVITAGDGTDIITDFQGVGTGYKPAASVIAEVDTLKFVGDGLSAENMLLTQVGSDLVITFEGVENTQVIRKDFDMEDLDNLQKSTGASADVGNILFDGQTQIQDSFDVFNANQNRDTIFNNNTVTFLNDLDNTTQGRNDSNDTINGQGGNDFLQGLSGDDFLRGGFGVDVLDGGAGNDTLDGGASFDFADYRTASAGVTVNLDTGTATGGAGNDVLINIEFVYGSSFNDTLYGGLGNDQLFGILGNDELYGGLGNDFLYGGDGNGELYGGLGDDSLYSGDGNDELYGGDGNDELFGNSGNDELNGSDGNDTLYGGGGNDTLNGGTGFDFAYYTNAATGVTVNLATGTATGGDGNDVLFNIEGVVGSIFNDTLIGDAGNNTLDGNAGNETLDGGAGFDATSYTYATTGVSINLGTGTASGGDGNDILLNIEGVIGSSFNDSLIGGTGGNTLNGRAGNDTLDGGVGFDFADYTTAATGVSVNLGTGTATGGEGNDVLLNIEGVYGSSFNDSLIGAAGNDTLNGRAGDDTLNGGTGFDFAYYTFAATGVSVNLGTGTASAGDGNDVLLNIEGVIGSRFNDTLVGDAGGNILNGDTGNDTLTGGAGADIFVINSLTQGIDTITDFTYSQGDKIQVSALGFGIEQGQFNKFTFDSSTGALFFEQTQFAALQPNSGFNPSLNINIV